VHELRRAEDLMMEVQVTVEASSTLDDAAHLLSERADVSWFLIVDSDRVIGILTRSDVLSALGDRDRGIPLGEIARRDWLLVGPHARLADVVSGMRSGTSFALVLAERAPVTPDAVRGLITKVEIADALAQLSEFYAG
jgi:predicted transcriptional regulator